jgi:SAM-dependent methyltransferase
MWSTEALNKCLEMKPKRVLDIGSGNGEHAAEFRKAGADVTEIEPNPPYRPHVWQAKYEDIHWPELASSPWIKYDLIWLSHVLEHQQNTHDFLQILHLHGGKSAITVPPAKKEIVGGHLTMWNAGLLLYNLVMANFDCRTAKVKTYDYNISVIVDNEWVPLPSGLKHDEGDIELLADRFPIPVKQGFNGDIAEVNW